MPDADVRRSKPEDIVLTERVIGAETPAQSHTPQTPKAGAGPNTALLDLILTSLDDDKAEDVTTIALRGKSEIADFMVVASGRSSRQVTSIAENLSDRIKHATGTSPRVEGKDAGDWVLIDSGDVVVHLFRPEVRDFYQLEKMWQSPEEQLRRPKSDA